MGFCEFHFIFAHGQTYNRLAAIQKCPSKISCPSGKKLTENDFTESPYREGEVTYI
jgi:hypothetical protein